MVINSAVSTDSYLILDTMLGVEGNIKTWTFQDRGHKRRGRSRRKNHVYFASFHVGSVDVLLWISGITWDLQGSGGNIPAPPKEFNVQSGKFTI